MIVKWIQIARTNRHQVWINKIREIVTVTKSNNLVFLTTTNKIHWVSNKESSPWIGKNKDRCNNIITNRCFPHTVPNLLSYQEASTINSNCFKVLKSRIRSSWHTLYVTNHPLFISSTTWVSNRHKNSICKTWGNKANRIRRDWSRIRTFWRIDFTTRTRTTCSSSRRSTIYSTGNCRNRLTNFKTSLKQPFQSTK